MAAAGAFFGLDGFHAQRKRRQRQLFVLQFDSGADRLARENVLRQLQAHLDAGERDRRKNAGHQNNGDQARENQEEQIVAGVQRGERDENDSADINPAFAGNAVLHFVADPAQAECACASTGTSVTATHAATSQRDERRRCSRGRADRAPPAAPEYSASSKATVERGDAREESARRAGRSALAQSCAMVDAAEIIDSIRN